MMLFTCQSFNAGYSSKDNKKFRCSLEILWLFSQNVFLYVFSSIGMYEDCFNSQYLIQQCVVVY